MPRRKSQPVKDSEQDKRIARLEREARRSKPEQKDLNGSHNDSLSTTMLMRNVSVMPQGTDNHEHLADNVLATSIAVSGVVRRLSTATADYDRVRAILYVDKAFNGANPDYTLLLNSQTMDSQENPIYKDKKLVLWDRVFVLSADTPAIQYRFVHKFKYPLKIMYNGIGGTAAEGRENQILMGSLTEATSNQPYHQFTYSLYYTDP